ncbi:MAG: RluA family pseudouridine synthase, partial [Ruminococcaceae bacterium]|nr:RluA family pseudouridine synthase [Oscillospiraceae bacterium]
MQQIIIEGNSAGGRFDKFLQKALPAAGTSFIYKMLRKKNITLNGKKAEGKEILVKGDVVCFFFADETYAKFSGKSGGIDTSEYEKAYRMLKGISVIYEDSNVTVLSKPVGVLSQKAEPTDISINEWFIGYLLKTNAISAQELSLFKPSICNRLDRNTSGIILCGKSMAGTRSLNKIIKDRSLSKFYRTICEGSIDSAGMLTGSLTKDEKSNTVKVSTDGEDIKTAYEPLQQLKKNCTYLEVDLITGKTHQIRAHFASIGHPLVGDTKYGKESSNRKWKETYGLQHQLLHAYRVV